MADIHDIADIVEDAFGNTDTIEELAENESGCGYSRDPYIWLSSKMLVEVALECYKRGQLNAEVSDD